MSIKKNLKNGWLDADLGPHVFWTPIFRVCKIQWDFLDGLNFDEHKHCMSYTYQHKARVILDSTWRLEYASQIPRQSETGWRWTQPPPDFFLDPCSMQHISWGLHSNLSMQLNSPFQMRIYGQIHSWHCSHLYYNTVKGKRGLSTVQYRVLSSSSISPLMLLYLLKRHP